MDRFIGHLYYQCDSYWKGRLSYAVMLVLTNKKAQNPIKALLTQVSLTPIPALCAPCKKEYLFYLRYGMFSGMAECGTKPGYSTGWHGC